MAKYIDYKKTNISWLGEVPKDWNIERVKKHFDFSKESTTPEGRNILSLTMKGIKIRDISTNEGQLPESFDGYRHLKKGDIVFNPMDLISGYVDLASVEGIISPAYSVLRRKSASKINLKYITLQFQRNYKEKIFWWYGQGVSFDHRWELKDKTLMNFPILIPTEQDQEKIVNEIYKIYSNINDFIIARQKYVNLLKEYKQSKINELVTKGLNPNVKMKDSGINWLGNIPGHWGRFKLKHLGTAHIGITYSPNDIVDQAEGVLVLRSSNIQKGKLCLEDCVYVRKSLGVNEWQLVREGDILICSRNGSAELIGKNIIIDKEIEGNTFGAFMTIYRSKYNNYLKYFFNSDFFKSQIGLFSTTTINQLTNSILNNLVIIMPQDSKEIEEMISAINEVEMKFEKLIIQAEKQVELIQQYRQSLIYELVTGKRKP